MKREPAPRLADVARAAGVSLSTASRGLADPELVRPQTRARIEQAARLLGYVPHGAARALASRRSRTLGVVVPTLDNPIFAHSIQALQRRAAEAGYTLLLGSHEYDVALDVEVTRALVERGVDGLALVGTDHSPQLYEFLGRAGLPVELLWTIDTSGYQHCIGFSNRSAAVRATQHLLGLGHRDFGMIAGYTAHNDRSRDRVAGVRDALSAHGLELPAHRFVETAYSISSGRAALGGLLAAGAPPTAIVCGNDLLAVGVVLECAARGIDVPARMSVVGFDDIELAAEISPPLTTVRVATAEIGRRAAERLVARLNGESVPRIEELPANLVVRGSTAAAYATAHDLRRPATHARADDEPV